jgi:hypothetical protein
MDLLALWTIQEHLYHKYIISSVLSWNAQNVTRANHLSQNETWMKTAAGKMFSINFLHTLVCSKHNFYDTTHLQLWAGSPKTSEGQVQKLISISYKQEFNPTHKKQER